MEPLVFKISKHLPTWLLRSIRRFLRNYYYFPFNASNDSLTLPKRLASFYGGGDPVAIGNHTVNSFISIADLKPHEKVLDVGCGAGRIAIPLTGYLDPEKGGRYEGFDIVPNGVKWCKESIERRFPNFHFQVPDIYNGVYNPKGKYKASQYKFPYDDNTFDFICLISIFTHMLSEDLQNYLSEINRVMKKGDGKCYITYFLLNPQARQLMKEGKSSHQFNYEVDKYCYISRADDPESAVAYEESFIHDIYRKYNLNITKATYGTWRIKQFGLDFQDVIIASKKLEYKMPKQFRET